MNVRARPCLSAQRVKGGESWRRRIGEGAHMDVARSRESLPLENVSHGEDPGSPLHAKRGEGLGVRGNSRLVQVQCWTTAARDIPLARAAGAAHGTVSFPMRQFLDGGVRWWWSLVLRFTPGLSRPTGETHPTNPPAARLSGSVAQ